VSSTAVVSPVPDDPLQQIVSPPNNAVAIRPPAEVIPRWRRILRTALPIQAMLVLLVGAAYLVPHCDDDFCCMLMNNFVRSWQRQLNYINGPPPV